MDILNGSSQKKLTTQMNFQLIYFLLALGLILMLKSNQPKVSNF